MAHTTEEDFHSLHDNITLHHLSKTKPGAERTTADIKAAMEWCKMNNMTQLATEGSPLQSLMNTLTEEDQAYVQRIIQ
jgi:hypothetical protein